MSKSKKEIPGISAFERVFREVEDKSVRKDFQEDLLIFRRAIGVPDEGFSEEEKPEQSGHEGIYPASWLAPYEENFDETFFQAKREFFRKQDLPGGAGHIIENYVLYNILELPATVGSLCKINTIQDLLDSKYLEDDMEHYPILLQISPYVSLNDIQDYLEGAYSKVIKPLQKSFRKPDVKIGGKRTRDSLIRKRDAFIDKNSHLPNKETKKQVKEIFDKSVLPNGFNEENVAKIKYAEKKKREAKI